MEKSISVIHGSTSDEVDYVHIYFIFQTGGNDVLAKNIDSYFQENDSEFPVKVLEMIEPLNEWVVKDLDTKFTTMDFNKKGYYSKSDFEYKKVTKVKIVYNYDLAIPVLFIYIPFDPEKLGSFYDKVSFGSTVKNANKTAAALLKRFNGNVEAAAQMLAKTLP